MVHATSTSAGSRGRIASLRRRWVATSAGASPRASAWCRLSRCSTCARSATSSWLPPWWQTAYRTSPSTTWRASSIAGCPSWLRRICASTRPSFPTLTFAASSSSFPTPPWSATSTPPTTCDLMLTTCASSRYGGPSSALSARREPSSPSRVAPHPSRLLPARAQPPCRQDFGHLSASTGSSSVLPLRSPLNSIWPRRRSMDRFASDVNDVLSTRGTHNFRAGCASSRDAAPEAT
jgi:hypothetical protein